jgi:[ribosomal protein S5]-alanine N-acetyltransferase
MSSTSWAMIIETDRLILRPQQYSDYECWYAGFASRLPQQYKYDEGQISLDGCDPHWFASLCQRDQEQALSDYACIFGIFFQADESAPRQCRYFNNSA